MPNKQTSVLKRFVAFLMSGFSLFAKALQRRMRHEIVWSNMQRHLSRWINVFKKSCLENWIFCLSLLYYICNLNFIYFDGERKRTDDFAVLITIQLHTESLGHYFVVFEKMPHFLNFFPFCFYIVVDKLLDTSIRDGLTRALACTLHSLKTL